MSDNTFGEQVSSEEEVKAPRRIWIHKPELELFNREPCDCGLDIEYARARSTADIAVLAEEAAKKWFVDTQKYINTIVDVDYHPIKKADAQAHLDEAIRKLSAIILSVFTGENTLVKQEEGTVAFDVVESKATSALDADLCIRKGCAHFEDEHVFRYCTVADCDCRKFVGKAG